MAGFDGSAGGGLGGGVTSEPGGTMAGFSPSVGSDPAGEMAGFGSANWRANRRYRATVSRSIPSSRAIRRWDQPPQLNVLIVCCISILSRFIAAQGHATDPDCNDYLTSKWLGLIRPLVAGFDRPLTIIAANLGLMVKIARNHEGLGLPLLDLVSEGNIGLIKAIERFDPGVNTPR
jgi:hypothetical protein